MILTVRQASKVIRAIQGTRQQAASPSLDRMLSWAIPISSFFIRTASWKISVATLFGFIIK